MKTALHTLTGKEKDTLRLIFRGHDAKSAARALDLSVHTINERLRAARRKLGVTSSREAARLLYECEEGPHENLAYKAIGDAHPHVPHKDPPIPQPTLGRAIWIGGILMFSIALVAILSVSVSGDAFQEGAADRGLTAELASRDASRVQIASDWLALVDKGEWEGSFEAAGMSFKELNTVEGWQRASEQARVPLGAVIKREAIAIDHLNAPPRGYIRVRFLTAFENREAAIEDVTIERENGVFKVVGYVIE